LIESYKIEILTACIGCLLLNIDLEGDHIYLPVVKIFSKNLPTKSELNLEWNKINFKTAIQRFRTRASENCPFTKNSLPTKSSNDEYEVNVVGCINSIILKHLCLPCYKIFEKNYRKREVYYISSFYHVLSYDVGMSGIRFTRFIEKPSSKMANVSVLALLQPISFTGWIVILAVIIAIGVTLNVTDFQINSYYWLFVTLLEQGDDRISFRNKSNWFLMLSWLVVLALFLRNIYTSSLSHS